MIRIVAYDIADPNRLRKVSTLCLDYGFRIEYSIFECDLKEKLFNEFWEQLLKIVNPAEDRCFACRLCADCLHNIRKIGRFTEIFEQKLYII